MNRQEELVFELSLLRVPNIGAVHARLLLEAFGTAKNIFQAPKKALESLEGIGTARARNIKSFQDFHLAQKEIAFIEKFQIRPVFLSDPDYPKRLLNCYDPPTMLFYKGPANLNHDRIISIVGTRKNTEYGKHATEKLIRELAPFHPIIISGLAFGIDTIAHKACIRNAIPTMAVLAHGLHTIYPYENAQLAKEMVHSGGLLSEFPSGTDPDRHNFPSRNRVVAGIADAVVVIETGIRGGSMITADLANSYNREVFAIPGRNSDPRSEGCNLLIREQKAILLTSGEELAQHLGWLNTRPLNRNVQPELFPSLTEEEKMVLQMIGESDSMHVDQLLLRSGLNTSQFAAALLNLEIHNLVNCLPGKRYKIAP